MSIAATLTLEQAIRREWAVIVVGAGPAGSFLALHLARQGFEVLLVDRATFPRRKVCGCCLSGAALATVRDAGLDTLVRSRGAVARRVRLAARRHSADLRLPAGMALSREVFDAALVQSAIDQGAHFLPGTTARMLVGDGSSSRRLRLRQDTLERTATSRIVIAADGLGGQVLAGEPGHHVEAMPRSRIGAGALLEEPPDWFEPGTIYMACGAGGYVGLVRLEDHRLDLAAALDAELVRQSGGIAGAVATILGATTWPICRELSDLPWRGTPALSRQSITPGGERYFVVGDAAGYVEPFTGEGMAWALASGVALTPIILRALRYWDRSLVREWRFCLRQLLGRRRLVCRALTQLLRHPILTTALVRVLGWMPRLAQPVIAALNRPIHSPGIALRFPPIPPPGAYNDSESLSAHSS